MNIVARQNCVYQNTCFVHPFPYSKTDTARWSSAIFPNRFFSSIEAIKQTNMILLVLLLSQTNASNNLIKVGIIVESSQNSRSHLKNRIPSCESRKMKLWFSEEISFISLLSLEANCLMIKSDVCDEDSTVPENDLKFFLANCFIHFLLHGV